MKKRLMVLGLCLAVVLAFAGCGKSSSGMMDNGSAESAPSLGNGSADLEAVADSTRKLIETVSVSMETKDFDGFLTLVRESVSGAEGYVESSSVTGATQSRAYRTATMTLRIPAERSDAFLTALSEGGSVLRKSVQVTDVTLQYVDTEAHLKALRAEQESLLRLLEGAQTVSDVMSVRSRLTEVEAEIEAYESTLRTFDNQVSYSTIDLSITEVEREQVSDGSVWSEIGGNLSQAFVNIGHFFRGLFIFAVSSLPYLVLIAAVVFVILLFSVILPRRRRKKRVQTAKNPPETR